MIVLEIELEREGCGSRGKRSDDNAVNATLTKTCLFQVGLVIICHDISDTPLVVNEGLIAKNICIKFNLAPRAPHYS